MNIFQEFQQKVLSSFGASPPEPEHDHKVDNLIALGVLLWVVAEADDKFLPKEKEKIEEVLRLHSQISKEDMPIVLRAIEEAAVTRIDIHSFTRAVCESVEKEHRMRILENLFWVACVDGELDNEEIEMIRKISNLFLLDHKDFVDTKVKIKREAGIGLPEL